MRTFTFKEIAKLLRVSVATVSEYKRNGEIRAINVGRAVGREKGRYRVLESDLQEFIEKRAVSPPPPTVRRRRKKRGDVVKFY